MMESEQIRQMADAIIDVTGFVEGGPAKIYKHYNAVLGQSIIIYVSNDEPTRVLPLNVLWLDTNRDRSTYKQFVRRVAKVPSNGFRNTWELVTEFMRLFIAQSYDPQDGTPGVGDVGIATKDTAGLAKLTTDAKPITAPRFVAVDDPRLKDKRTPLPHDEMHVEKPLVDVIGVVNMANGTPAQGGTFVAESSELAQQRKLKKSEVTG